MSNSQGKILCEVAYSLGKMLDHSSWNFPRGITPSDGDMILDNQGHILYIELSSKTCVWDHLSTGQHKLIRHLVEAGQGKISAALAQHNVRDRQIDSLKDVIRFSVLRYVDGELVPHGPYPGELWEVAVNKLLGFHVAERSEY